MSGLKWLHLFVTLVFVSISFVACDSSAKPMGITPVPAKPTAYVVTLICDDCAAAGIRINVWQNAGISRGSISFSVPHNTKVNVVDSKSADDGRRWYKVEFSSKAGWIAQDFVRR